MHLLQPVHYLFVFQDQTNKMPWRHPRSKHRHQLDLILIQRSAIDCVMHVRVPTIALIVTCTDNPLMCCKIRMQQKKFYSSKKQGISYIDVSKMLPPNLTQTLTETHEKKLSVIQPRRSGKPLIALPLATFGKRNTKTQDWFKAKFSVVTQVIEAKRTVLTEHKRSPSQKKSQLLSAARNKAQQTARNCANEYWKEISNTIQAAAISRDIRGIV